MKYTNSIVYLIGMHGKVLLVLVHAAVNVYFQTNPSTLVKLLFHIHIMLACNVKIHANKNVIEEGERKAYPTI